MNVTFARGFLACTLTCSVLSNVPLPGQDTATTAASPLAIPATDEGLPGAGPIRRADWFRERHLPGHGCGGSG